MRRIDTATKAVDLFGAGKHGFKDGDPALAILATKLNAAFFNSVQEELARAIEASGLTLAPGDNTQLYQAIKLLGCQPGEVSFFARNTPPTGYLKANGALVSRTTYAALFAAIGTTWGAGDGSTTFALPDGRGEFFRGWDDGRGVDAGRVLGSAQAGDLQSHDHLTYATDKYSSPASLGGSGAVAPHNTGSLAGLRTGATGGTETRPRNVALLACIKY